MNSDLKPCPFCGMQPHLSGEGKILWVVCPEGSPCLASGMAMGIAKDNEAAGVEAWNRRAPEAPKE